MKNKYYMLVFLFYLFLFRDWLEQISFIFGYIDELIALIGVILFIYKTWMKNGVLHWKKDDKKKWCMVCLIGIVGVGIWATILYGYQNFMKIVVPDLIACIKFWTALYLGYVLFEHCDCNKYKKRFRKHIKFVTICFFILILFDNIHPIFQVYDRYGFRSTHLFYSHPSIFASICGFLFLMWTFFEDERQPKLIWPSLILLLLCTTFRSKAIATAFALAFLYYVVLIRKKKFTWKLLIALVPIGIFIGWEQIILFYTSYGYGETARSALLTTSIEIAKDYFPIGTGFGTFGSNYSVVEYSPVYSIYGIQNVYGISEGYSAFVSDSFWPMILGQFGIIGILLYGGAVLSLMKDIQKIRIVNSGHYVAAIGAMIYLLISSLAESAFVNPYAIQFAVLIGVCLSQKASK